MSSSTQMRINKVRYYKENIILRTNIQAILGAMAQVVE